MSLFKSYAQDPSASGFTVKVVYNDIAGAFGGWFLTRVQGNFFADIDPDSDPSDGPDDGSLVYYQGTSGGTSWATAGSKADRYGRALVEQVNARLNRYLGEGHSAKWTATIVQDVTPAVINDDWGTS